jgi:putative peptidoglycan lipid II flippase
VTDAADRSAATDGLARATSATDGRAAGSVAAGILVSRVAGLARFWLFARFFGDGPVADAFNAALRIPNVIRNLLGEGALAAAFVPVYGARLATRDPAAARALANATLGVLLLAASALTLLGIAIAPWLTQVVVPGYDAERAALTTRLVRVLFPMAGLMVLSGWCLAVQNAHRRFLLSYASAAMWSLAQVVLLAGWGGRADDAAQLAWWLAWATLAGAALQLGIQLPVALRAVAPVRPAVRTGDDGAGPVLRNLLPVLLALGVAQLSGLFDVFLASFLPVGSPASLGYANQLMLLPVSVFGVSVAASALPEIAREHATAQAEAIRARIRAGWSRMLFYVVPSAVAFVAFGDVCVGILYRSGAFGLAEQRRVHAILAAYALALVSYGSVRLLASAHHALQDYRTPLRASMVAVALSAAIAAALALPWRTHPFSPVALALGSALGSYANLALLARGLRGRLGPLTDAAMRGAARRMVLASLLAGALALAPRLLLDGAHPWLLGVPVLATYGVGYLVVSWWWGSAEAARWLRRPARGRG